MCIRGKSREDPCISVKSRFGLYLRDAHGHAVRPPSLRSRRRSPSPHWGERRRRRRVVHPFGESERTRSETPSIQCYLSAVISRHRAWKSCRCPAEGASPGWAETRTCGARSRGLFGPRDSTRPRPLQAAGRPKALRHPKATRCRRPGTKRRRARNRRGIA